MGGTKESRERCFLGLVSAMDNALSKTNMRTTCPATKCVKSKGSINNKKCSEMYSATLAGYFKEIVGRKNKLDAKFAQVDKQAVKYDKDNSNRGSCPSVSSKFRLADGSCNNPLAKNKDVGARGSVFLQLKFNAPNQNRLNTPDPKLVAD